MSTPDGTPAVVGVAVIRPHVMRLLFDDGVVRDVQYLPGEASGPLLDPLSDPKYFAQVSVDQEAGTVAWPNGLDLAPEVLHGDYEAEHSLGFHDVTVDEEPPLQGRVVRREANCVWVQLDLTTAAHAVA